MEADVECTISGYSQDVSDDGLLGRLKKIRKRNKK